MAKKVYALFPEERNKECDHPGGFTWSGKIPCTGRQVCHLCGSEKPAELPLTNDNDMSMMHVMEGESK